MNASKKIVPIVPSDRAKTWLAKQDEIGRNWWIVDVKGQKLGKVANRIAQVLRGKHKPQFTPHMDTGDFVIVINSEQIEMTGAKWLQKKYYRHSRYFGSLKEMTAEQMREKRPEFILEEAVKGMLPKNKLSRHLIRKLKAYRGAIHPHAAQKPQPLTIN